nr:MAG TPA: hypothetical protein [Caudoviricetes sp.]
MCVYSYCFCSFFFRYLFSFRDCTVPLRGCVNHIRELYSVRKLVLMVLASGLNNMLPCLCGMGCSITLLLERVDFTGRTKMARRGVD